MNKKMLSSTVFKKFIMGLTGLALVGFIITHLLGNLLLFKSDPAVFNQYAHTLAGFGIWLYVAEIGLATFFLFHAFTGIRLVLASRAARPVKYGMHKTKEGESKWGASSNNMAVTGSALLLFLVLHVIHFKFGPGLTEGYVAQVDGVEARDLHRLVLEEFKNPLITGSYVAAMIFLGVHLRHGIWSALQSLGLTRQNNSKALYCVGGLLGILFAVGFIAIPVYLYFFGGQS